MIKRNPNPVRERNLPITTNDSNQTTNSLPKTYNQNRRRSTGKSSVLLRIIGGTLLCFVAFLYVFGTRHILLISLPIPASSSGRESINNAVDKTDDNNRGKGNGNKKSETDSRRRQPSSFSQKPRTLGYYYALADSESFVGTERLDPNLKILYDNHKSGILRGEFMTKKEKKRQHYLLDSKSYEGGEAETMEDQGGHCVAQYKWQEKSFPTCNHLMEIDMTNLNFLPMFHENHYNNKHSLPLASSSLHSYSRLLANGYWRDVWSIENLLRYKGEQEETFILKTMRYKHDYEARNYDRHRRDAVAMEQLTASEFIMDIYAACGNSGLFQYADGGSLDDSIWYNYNISDKDKEKPWSPKEKLIIAYQAVSGLADLHNFAKEGVPAVAHTDVGPDQFVYVNEAGVYKLNDFNRARFIAKNEMTEELCTYKVGNNPGVFRSPEEYAYGRQSEKVDIFQLGNVLYSVLTGMKPFKDIKDSKSARKKIIAGERPHIPSSYRNSTDPFDQALLKLIDLSWIHEPKKRASARELQKFIIAELERLGVEKDQ